MNKLKTTLETTSDNGTFKKARKAILAQKGEINCDRCPYHAIENATKQDHSKPKRKDHRRS